MALEIPTIAQAVGSVREVLCLDAGCVGADARFELVRATVWSLSSHGAPVHISKVLNVSIPPWRLLSERPDAVEEGLRAELRASLESLLDAGDLVETAGGRWAPATTRLVRLEHDPGYLLVGGAPLFLLPVPPGDIQHHGPYRHIGRSEALSAVLHEEELSSWAGLPETPLREWAQDLLGSLERLPYSPASHESFEFYSPGNARLRAPQFKRWVNEPEAAKGTFLARRMRLYGAQEYRLVDVASGRVSRACELPASEARRLMYALDSEAGNPVQARCSIVGRDLTEVVLTSELPHPEQRILAALGAVEIPVDRYFERRWMFRRGQDLALNRIRSLGIDVAVSLRGERR